MIELVSIIPVGKERALPHELLENMMGTTDRRVLRLAIGRERKLGVPILPDGKGGYYIADLNTSEGRKEMKSFIKKINAMSTDLQEVSTALVATSGWYDNNIILEEKTEEGKTQ